MVLVNGVQEAKMEIVKSGKYDLSQKQKVEIQQSMLDNRRKEPINEGAYFDEDSS
jgi:hypothetical protein